MRVFGTLLLAGTAGGACLGQAVPDDGLLSAADIRIRDPYVYADTGRGVYLLYAQSGNRAGSGYCVILARSESGGIAGPWTQQRAIYTGNSGHGMFFHTIRRPPPHGIAPAQHRGPRTAALA